MPMKAADIGAELVYPVTEMAVLLAMITFALLAALADAAGIIGLWLGLIILPAFFRYAIYLLEARAHGQVAPVPGIEMFNLFENFWALFPAVLLGAFVSLEWYVVVNYSRVIARGLLLPFMFVYPASIAVLGVTRSPIASLNPVSLWRMIKVCGSDYIWIPVVTIPIVFFTEWMTRFKLPFLALDFTAIFAFFLLFTLTGAVLRVHHVVKEVAIEMPVAETEAEIAATLINARQKVVDHAYGFVSRGNREGGFAHIRQWLENETDEAEAYLWFLHEMLKWENKVPALFFAQEYLGRLLESNMDKEALKLIARCLHEDARWRPLPENRDAVQELATRHGRQDLLAQLRE
jgi:hypothetical protein